MTKKLPLFLLLAILCSGLNAQLSNYYFIPSQGTYTPITGTAVTFSIPDNADDGVSGLIPIGFTFNYNGTNYTQLDACTNGFVQLGTAIDKVAGNINSVNLANSYYRNVLAPLWDDHTIGSPGGLRYETSGSAPNRVFTVQWSNVKWDYNNANAAIEFQIKLYETSSRIEFIYNQLPGVQDGAAIIGMNVNGSGTGSFISLSNAGPAPALNSDESYYFFTRDKPATGQVYAFFVPQPCTGTPVAGTTVSTNDFICPSSNFTLSVAGATIAKNITYQWQSSADGANWQNISAATDTNLTTQITANTYFRRGITCSGNTAYSNSKLITIGVLPATYATLPFTENFQTNWLSNCSVRERPSLHFTNSVATGTRSWRRNDDGAAAGWPPDPFWDTWLGGSATRSARFRVRDEDGGLAIRNGDLDLYVDCSPAGIKELRFKHVQSQGGTQMSVWYSTDGGLNFTPIDTIMGWFYWREHHLIIPSNSATTIIRFRGQNLSYTSNSDIGLDDIELLVQNCSYPTGLEITNLQQTSATISWNGTPGAEYEYKLVTIAEQQVGAVQTIADTQVTVTLNPSNNYYYFYVRRKCGASDFSSWSWIAFTPSANCGAATLLTCGTPNSFMVDNGSGTYNMWLTDRENGCDGGGGFGKEKIFRFIPQVTGNYQLKITALSVSNAVSYFIKDAAKGCGPVDWTCLGEAYSPKTFNLGTLTAGKEYYLLQDNWTIANGHSETIVIECLAANPDCITGAITPTNPAALCNGNTQLLTVTGGTAWQWFRDGVLIDGATSTTYTATQSGKYAVAITNGTCTSVASVTIPPSSIPAPVVTVTGNTSFCEGGSVQLSTTAVGGYTYQWQKDGADINGQTGTSYTANASGNYTVKGTAPGGCNAVSLSTAVTVRAIPSAPTVTPNTPIGICTGGSISLTSSAASGNQWYRSNNLISGATSATLNLIPNFSGLFTVTTTVNGCTSAHSAGVQVTITPKPANPVITFSSPTTFCQGDSVVLTSSAAANNQWYRNGATVTGEKTFAATETGNYSVKVIDNGCSSDLSAVVPVTTKPVAAAPTITAGGPTTFCQGGSVVLTASTGVGHQWFKDGTLAGNTQTYTASESGNYTAKIIQDGCASPASTATTVAVNSIPPVPTITPVTGNTLSSSATTGNQWYKDGSIITGATGQTYAATASGLYTVQATLNGCASTSASFNFVYTGIVDPATWNKEVVAYPNPVEKKLFLTNSSLRQLHLKLLDITGRTVYEGRLSNSAGSIELNGIVAGVYQLLITDMRKKETITLRVIKK